MFIIYELSTISHHQSPSAVSHVGLVGSLVALPYPLWVGDDCWWSHHPPSCTWTISISLTFSISSCGSVQKSKNSGTPKSSKPLDSVDIIRPFSYWNPRFSGFPFEATPYNWGNNRPAIPAMASDTVGVQRFSAPIGDDFPCRLVITHLIRRFCEQDQFTGRWWFIIHKPFQSGHFGVSEKWGNHNNYTLQTTILMRIMITFNDPFGGYPHVEWLMNLDHHSTWSYPDSKMDPPTWWWLHRQPRGALRSHLFAQVDGSIVRLWAAAAVERALVVLGDPPKYMKFNQQDTWKSSNKHLRFEF